jgi:transposase
MDHNYNHDFASFSPNLLFTPHFRGSALSEKEKLVIINVYCYFRRENPKLRKEDVVQRTADATGVSQSTIYRIKKEKNQGKVQDGRRNVKNKKPSTQHFEEWVGSLIRNKIHRDFFSENRLPTLRKLHAAVRADPTIPTVSLSTLHRILRRIGFIYRSRKRNSVLLERPDITEWRHRYLRSIRKHRRDNRSIIFTDETWVNAGHATSKVWEDTQVESRRQAFTAGLSTGLKGPSGKGSRLIVTHAGSRAGFVPGADMIFQAKKNEGDYHGEMNAACYEHWFREQLLPNIPTNSVIVMDNASYHSSQIELLPRRGWKKADIQAWLTKKNITWGQDMIIAELLNLVEPIRSQPQYKDKRIDKIAREAGHEVLRLPPYHCELNPIELVSILNY